MSWGVVATAAVLTVLVTYVIRNRRAKHSFQRDQSRALRGGSPLFVEIHDRVHEADLSVHAARIFGGSAPTFRLSVQPITGSPGRVKWTGKDHWGNQHDLHALNSPAVLIIAQETLPLLRESALWNRVQDVENV